MEQNNELATAWEFVEHTGISIFLTGKAGTGKTTFLKAVREHSAKRMIVVAPTGVAAINAGGMTIHSFFQLPLSPYVPGTSIKDRYDFGKEKRRIIRTLDMVVIDEISMVRSDLLDAIDTVLRRYRDHSRPFGGVQLLMIGDLQQLTPVVTPQDEEILRGHYDTPYFFGSKALSQISYVTIQLTQVFRQRDKAFVDLLNHVRDGKLTASDMEMLRSRYQPTFAPMAEDGYIRLTTHNRMADSYNENKLAKLKGESHVYTAKIEGIFPEYSYPADVRLELKPGAQVMFVKNDASGARRYYNGRIGHVVGMDGGKIVVRCTDDPNPIEVEPQEWENAKYVINEKTKVIETQVQGVFRQYPLRLAWAITIHKSQGLTFERAIIDAGRSFASGQVYVALSRCKSLEGLVLASPIHESCIINDHRVSDYIVHQREAAERSVASLSDLKDEYFRFQLLDLFDFGELYQAEQLVYRTLLEYFKGCQSLTTLHGDVVRNIKTSVMDVAYKWQSKMRAMKVDELRENDFLERVKRGAGYFLDAIEAQLSDTIEKTKRAESQNVKGNALMEERFKELWMSYLAKNKVLRKMEEETFDVPRYMMAKQEAMLDAMDVVSPGARSSRPRRRRKNSGTPFGTTDDNGQNGEAERKSKRKKGETYRLTYEMFKQGQTPADIAKERGLTLGTVYGHLGRFVKSGDISADKVIGASKVKAIRYAISQLPEGATIRDVKDACRADITWDEIRLMMIG